MCAFCCWFLIVDVVPAACGPAVDSIPAVADFVDVLVILLLLVPSCWYSIPDVAGAPTVSIGTASIAGVPILAVIPGDDIVLSGFKDLIKRVRLDSC